MNQKVISKLLVAFVLALVISSLFSYNSPSLISRTSLFIAFLTVLTSTILLNYWGNKGESILSMLFFTSLLFLISHPASIMPYYTENTLNSETFVLASKYSVDKHLVFSSAHSYFFLPSLIIYFLNTICNIPAIGIVFISLSMYVIITTLLGILIFRRIWQLQLDEGHRNIRSILPPIIAFFMVSSLYSERSQLPGSFRPLPLFLALLALCFIFSRGLIGRKHMIIVLLLVVGVTFGSTDGIFLLIPFFFLFSMSRRTMTAILYALIPIFYLIYTGYTYTTSLKTYASFTFKGFQVFLEDLAIGQLPKRVIPWQRTTLPTWEDTLITSVTYLSLMIASLVVASISIYYIIAERRKHTIYRFDIILWSSSTCLWLALGLAAMTYIGSSVMPEAIFSDIRTIAIVFVSLLLPFLFLSEHFMRKITANRILLILLAALIILASLRADYEAYPKSIFDPINVVEDPRLGLNSVFSAIRHIDSYYKTGGIISDYIIIIRADILLPYPQYEKRLLNETSLATRFDNFPERSILVFDIEGIKYPSIYHTPEAYEAAYDYSQGHNRIYENGVILIITHRDRIHGT